MWQVLLFKDAELAFIKLVSRYCKPVFIPKDEYIIVKGDICPLVSNVQYVCIYIYIYIYIYQDER